MRGYIKEKWLTFFLVYTQQLQQFEEPIITFQHNSVLLNIRTDDTSTTNLYFNRFQQHFTSYRFHLTRKGGGKEYGLPILPDAVEDTHYLEGKEIKISLPKLIIKHPLRV